MTFAYQLPGPSPYEGVAVVVSEADSNRARAETVSRRIACESFDLREFCCKAFADQLLSARATALSDAKRKISRIVANAMSLVLGIISLPSQCLWCRGPGSTTFRGSPGGASQSEARVFLQCRACAL